MGESAAAVSAAVLETARAGAATTADACGRGTLAPEKWVVAAGGGGRRAHAHRPSASSWGSWEAGAFVGTSAATLCLAPAVGPARALTASAGTMLGVVRRGRPSVLAARASERVSLVASRPAAAEREMVAVAVAVAVVAVAGVVEQSR
jgi:hypothetical protein